MVIKRRTLHSSPEFLDRLAKLQGKIKSMTGKEPSLAKLTKEINELSMFEEIEKQILEKNSKKDFLKVRFDK